MAYPRVTVIMPIRNEGAFIETSLGAVLSQDYPYERLEVLVVDGMSEDNTRDIVTALIQELSNAALLENPGMIASTALNIGLEHASGDIIIRVDGHVFVPTDYVSNCIRVLQSTGADCVGGAIRSVGLTPPAHAIALAMASPFGVGGRTFRVADNRGRWVDTLAFGAYRRDIFDRVGKFDEELVRNQDDEFNYRLRAAGGRIWMDPSIHSQYYVRSTLASLWRQYFQYGFWKVRVFQKVLGSARWRHWAPPLFALGVVGGMLALPVRALRILYLVGLGVYLALSLVVSMTIAARSDWRLLPRLPLAFATMHLAYGLGFWRGVLRFGSPWTPRP